jgi:hypothetical protein
MLVISKVSTEAMIFCHEAGSNRWSCGFKPRRIKELVSKNEPARGGPARGGLYWHVWSIGDSPRDFNPSQNDVIKRV